MNGNDFARMILTVITVLIICVFLYPLILHSRTPLGIKDYPTTFSSGHPSESSSVLVPSGTGGDL